MGPRAGQADGKLPPCSRTENGSTGARWILYGPWPAVPENVARIPVHGQKPNSWPKELPTGPASNASGSTTDSEGEPRTLPQRPSRLRGSSERRPHELDAAST